MFSRSGAGRSRRLLIALGLALVAGYLGYLGAANWFLASETGDRVINRKPEKLRLQWSRARTWLPGIVVLDEVTITGANRRFDWTASLDHVRVHVSLWRLPRKIFHSDHIVGSGLIFRLRQHEAAGANGDAGAAAGAVEGPEPPEPAPRKRRKPWHLELDGISIANVHEVSIGQSSLIGRGEISGGLEVTIRGPLRFDVLGLAFTEAKLLRAGETVGENVAFEVAASSSPFEPGADTVREILGGVSGSARLTADVESIAALDFLLEKPEWLSFSGSGHLETAFELDDGVVLPGGRLDFDAKTLQAQIVDWTVEGGGAIALRLPEEGPQAAALDVDFDQFAIRRGEREVAHIHGENLRVALEASAFDLERGLEDLDLRVDLPPSRVDFTAYDSYLPKSPFQIKGGSGTLASWFEYSEDDESARGEVDLSVAGASAIAGSLGFGGDLRLHTTINSGDLATQRFDVSGSSLELRNVRVTKAGGAVESEGWWATFATGKARLDMKEPLAAEVVVNGRMRDAKPFLTALAAQRKVLFWIDELVSAKDIEGRATIDVDGKTMAARNLDIRGRKLTIEGDIAVEGRSRDGLLFIEYGPFSTGVELGGGESEWKLFRARRWFDERRSERGRRPLVE
jgi:hypothetical protein